jgi:ABC-type uncharacterized transport system permease subunit
MEIQDQVITKKDILNGVGRSLVALFISLPLMQFMPSLLYVFMGNYILSVMTSGSPGAYMFVMLLTFSGTFFILNTILLIFTKNKGKKIGVLIGYIFFVIPLIIVIINILIAALLTPKGASF